MKRIFHLRGRTVVVNGEPTNEFHPYFYVIGEKPRRDEGIVGSEEVDLNPYIYRDGKYVEGSGKVYKVLVEKPSLVTKLRERYKLVSQSYIKYSARASIDLNTQTWRDLLPAKDPTALVEEKPDLKVAVFDIEVVGSKIYLGLGFGEDEHKIFPCSVSDTLCFMNIAKELLSLNVDYLVGYNNWEYDQPKLMQSIPLFRTKYAILTNKGYTPVLDLYVFARSRFASSLGLQESGLDLVSVASQVALTRDESEKALQMKTMRSKLNVLTDQEIKTYLSSDLFITYKLARTWVPLLEIAGRWANMSAITLNQVAESASPGHIDEVLIHKWLAERHGMMLQDTRRTFDLPGLEKVKAVKAGIFKGVAEYDFSALYPTLYKAKNVDATTVKECAEGYEVVYIVNGTTKKVKLCFEPGPIHEVEDALYNLRRATKRFKDERDKAAKIFANALYGIFTKKGLGIHSIVGAFIFEYSEVIHKDVFSKYGAIYGDTDSIFVVTDKPNELLDDINNYVKGKYDELLEMKLEEYWKVVLIPSSKGGQPSRKNLVKVGENEVVLKGTLFRMKDAPTYVRLKLREWVKEAIEGGKTLSEVMAEEGAIPPDMLLIEDSLTAKDFFVTVSGKEKKGGLDRKRARALGYLAASLLSTNQTLAIYRENKSIYMRTPKGIAELPPQTIIGYKFLPINEQGEEKKYIYLVRDKPILVAIKAKYNKASEQYEVVLTKKQMVDEKVVQGYALRWIRQKDYLFKPP
jgi:DNA polymerase I